MKAEYIDHMGDDLAVVNAARVSFDRESEWGLTCQCGIQYDSSQEHNKWVGCGADQMDCHRTRKHKQLSTQDTRLIKYLAKHNHWTPFAHTSIKLRMSAPVPIRTQCFKHKAGFTENEESRRYIDSVPDIHIPDAFRQSAENVKQGSGGVHPRSEYWRQEYITATDETVAKYIEMINDGVCAEQARFILPQGAVVNWIWTGNLASFARYYNQRTDPHAQLEGHELAKQVGDIIAQLYPVSWEALTVSK